MIRGHKRFAERFQDFQDCYIAIGGLATHGVLHDEGLKFRATKDFDLILIIEALRPEFFKKFWSFIREGGYEVKQASENPRQYYRFKNPTSDEFPSQIELFSKLPDAIIVDGDIHITPIPAGEDQYSLSAILMDDTYYAFVKANTAMYHGIPIATQPVLICLKARAFLEMSRRKQAGDKIDSDEIRKHKNDVFRLAVTFTGTEEIVLPDSILSDLRAFVELMKQDPPNVKDIIKNMGITTALDSTTILTAMSRIFKIE